MNTIWVPFSTLNHAAHSAGTKLVWLLYCCMPQGASQSWSDQRLSQRSGLSLRSIARARARLAQAPLAPCFTQPHPSCAAVPVALLTATALSPAARLLYGQLQGAPDFADRAVSLTYGELSALTGVGDDTLRQAAAELAAGGWLSISREHRRSPVRFTLLNPAAAQARARLSAIRRKVRKAPHRGEALLREYLNLLVALDQYEDHAAPHFLANPYTGELMEFDRYYPAAGVALEFQGGQHFDVTGLTTLEATVKQVGRDAMKAFLCRVKGIELVAILPEELSRQALEQKLPQRLPRRDLTGQEPLLTLLEGLAAEYRARTAAERQRKGPA